MLNKLQSLIREYDMISSGDTVICAVSGGADSMALLWSMYLLREKLGIDLQAAHFNHGLRGRESDRDEAFVRDFCQGFQIPLHVGSAPVTAGKKGLEAAAREARYGFFATLPGKIATAHTADDNAETVLMHLVRGTGLKGLGGITPVRGALIRPMLNVTRREVLAFLESYSVGYITDSSNETDDFLRNRLRHQVMPVLCRENPRLAENLSAMAQDLRRDSDALESLAKQQPMSVSALQQQPLPIRNRAIARFLEENGVKEPERAHIDLARQLLEADNPSARGDFPGGVTVTRNYDTLQVLPRQADWETATLPIPGTAEVAGWRITAASAAEPMKTRERFTVTPTGTIRITPRRSGDTMRLAGGTKSVKKIMIDQKIPAHLRDVLPVLRDDAGLIAVCGIGANLDRITPVGVMITLEKMR